MEDVDHLTLLNLFHRCAHQLHHIRKNCGQGRILILLNEKGTLTQRELIELTGRRSATLSEQLDCMDKAIQSGYNGFSSRILHTFRDNT